MELTFPTSHSTAFLLNPHMPMLAKNMEERRLQCCLVLSGNIGLRNSPGFYLEFDACLAHIICGSILKLQIPVGQSTHKIFKKILPKSTDYFRILI